MHAVVHALQVNEVLHWNNMDFNHLMDGLELVLGADALPPTGDGKTIADIEYLQPANAINKEGEEAARQANQKINIENLVCLIEIIKGQGTSQNEMNAIINTLEMHEYLSKADVVPTQSTDDARVAANVESVQPNDGTKIAANVESLQPTDDWEIVADVESPHVADDTKGTTNAEPVADSVQQTDGTKVVTDAEFLEEIKPSWRVMDTRIWVRNGFLGCAQEWVLESR